MRLRLCLGRLERLIMRSLLLPPAVKLRPKSLNLLREVGVKLTQTEDGYWFVFSPDVAEVVSCILETEKNLTDDGETLHGLDGAIAAVDERVKN